MTKRYAKPLTPEEMAQLPDDAIDTSDIPARDAAFWEGVKVNPPKTKPTVSLRLPEEVIDYFKAENPKGYTGRMAAVLSAYVQAQQAGKSNG